MAISDLLNRLDRVRQTGPDRWISACPAHEDRSPSLTIRLLADGRVLAHCFGGCGTDAVLAAVGLEFSSLFPDPALAPTHAKPERQPFPALDVLRAVAFEILIADVAIAMIQRRGWLNDDECERLALASERLQSALALAGAGGRAHG